MKIIDQKITRIFKRLTKKKQIHEAVLFVENMNGDFSYKNGYGGKDIDTPILIASITKLFTTACILNLLEQGELSLDDEVTKYFSMDTLKELHNYKGKEHSTKLTLAHLLFQTSGLPDVYEEGGSFAKKRAVHRDLQFTFNEKINMTKQLKPHFAPTLEKRAHYSDMNFDMLGKVIEKVTNLPLEDVYKQFILDPLALTSTYLLQNDNDFVPNVYYKDKTLNRPVFIRSCRASGGIISTARELMIVLKAFFDGKLFNKTILHQLKVVNRLQPSMFPIQYGAGYMVIPLDGLSTFFMGKGELKGHSGSTGSFAFYYPQKDLFFVGDVNQMSKPALPVQLVMRLAISLKT